MDTITVADLLARNVGVEWFEAVALVRGVCSALVSECVEDSTPDPAQILLASSGKVSITGTAMGEVPVRRLGQLLQALLLRTSDPPVTLRLALSEAMASPPVFGSVMELDAALAYFERPERYSVLRLLYDRAMSVPAEPSAGAVQDLDTIAPLPVADEKSKKKRRKPGNRRATALVTCGALAIAVLTAAYQRGLLGRTGSLKSAGDRATTAVDKAVFATVSAVTEIAGMGKLIAPGATVAPDVPVPAVGSSSTGRRRSAHAPAITLAGVPVKVFDLQPAADIDPAVESPAAAPPAVLAASADVSPIVDTRVYGPQDTEVQAPLAIRPHLPTSLPDGILPAQLARIELVIAPDGSVEAVKLLPGARPVTVSEAMLLSVAKAWRFSPALKAGHTVRYRKTVFLSDK